MRDQNVGISLDGASYAPDSKMQFLEDRLHDRLLTYEDGGIVRMDIDKRIAVASDTHFGNALEAFKEYGKFCDIARRNGVRQLFHCGDMFAGEFKHAKYAERLIKQTPLEQADYVIDNYPKGLETHWIKGNHDPWFVEYEKDGKIVREEMAKYVCRYRRDMHFLGYHSVRLIDRKDGFVMDVRHSNGNIKSKGDGREWAEKWKEKLQGSEEKPDWSQPKDNDANVFEVSLKRYIRTMPEDMRPDMLLSGHVHDNWDSLYKGIYVISAGCFVKFRANGNHKNGEVSHENHTHNGNGDGEQPVCGFIVNMERKDGRLKSVIPQKIFSF